MDPDLKTSLANTSGWIYLKTEMTDSALQTFQNLVRSNPGHAPFRYHLGSALYEKADRQRAREELQAALAAKGSAPVELKIRNYSRL